MKKLITICAFLLATAASAQKHVYEDLLVLFVDEKYEKCIFKAEGYTQADATKKDALPFLYVSMCLYEMSKLEKYNVDYPKAARDAVKWAEKYRKKDKNKEFFDNYADFWEDLNTMAMEKGMNGYDDGDFSKAKQTFDAMVGYYPENPGAWMMLAIVQYKSNLAKEGDLSMTSFDKAIAAAGDISTLPPDQKKLLKNALIRYADLQVAKGDRAKARKYAEIGKDVFMEEPDFKGMWDSL